MPRPTKLTRTIQDALCWRLACGDFLTDACRSVGVAPSTVYEWLARGEGRHPTRPAAPRYVRFAEAVAPLIPEEEPDVDEFADTAEPERNRSANSTQAQPDDEFADAFPDTVKSEHMRAASEHMRAAAPPKSTNAHRGDEFADAQNRRSTGPPASSPEPPQRRESGEVSPRAWLSQRSRRAVSIYDMEF
jgi:hypothetical protein